MKPNPGADLSKCTYNRTQTLKSFFFNHLVSFLSLYFIQENLWKTQISWEKKSRPNPIKVQLVQLRQTQAKTDLNQSINITIWCQAPKAKNTCSRLSH